MVPSENKLNQKSARIRILILQDEWILSDEYTLSFKLSDSQNHLLVRCTGEWQSLSHSQSSFFSCKKRSLSVMFDVLHTQFGLREFRFDYFSSVWRIRVIDNPILLSDLVLYIWNQFVSELDLQDMVIQEGKTRSMTYETPRWNNDVLYKCQDWYEQSMEHFHQRTLQCAVFFPFDMAVIISLYAM